MCLLGDFRSCLVDHGDYVPRGAQKVVDSETFLNHGICGIGIWGVGMIILLLICFATEETVKDLE